ncbi:MAG: C45 family peptidase [Pseudomonadota bacterium]
MVHEGVTRWELEQLTVQGHPRDLGEQQGEHFRERIQQFIAVRFAAVSEYAAELGRDDITPLREIGRTSQAIFADWDPEASTEHEGIARGAQVDSLDLFIATNITDMRDVLLLPRGEASPPELEGCTAVLLPGRLTQSGKGLAGQTWDLNPTDVDYVVGVHRKPVKGPETWSLTCTGCLTLIGMNSEGLALGTTNIKMHGSKPGVGYLNVLHRAIRSPGVEEASRIILDAPRSGAHTFWLADPKQQVEWEAGPDAAVARTADDQAVTRTNHCLAPEFIERQGEPTSETSAKRLAKATAVVEAGNINPTALRTLFSDRSEGINSINRYHEDGTDTATNGVFIASPSDRRLWACRGPADRGEWIEHAW